MDSEKWRVEGSRGRVPDATAFCRVFRGRRFAGDCPDFRGAVDVAVPTCLIAAKMGLSPLRCPNGADGGPAVALARVLDAADPSAHFPQSGGR